MKFYLGLAILVLLAHVLFILWVVFGAFLARRRPVLQWVHIASLVWGILTEAFYFTCPLTLLENWLEARAKIEPYHGGFLLHYLEKLVYPDISATALASVGATVCIVNLGYYARTWWIRGSAIAQS
jgi:hypothetical protein